MATASSRCAGSAMTTSVSPLRTPSEAFTIASEYRRSSAGARIASASIGATYRTPGGSARRGRELPREDDRVRVLERREPRRRQIEQRAVVLVDARLEEAHASAAVSGGRAPERHGRPRAVSDVLRLRLAELAVEAVRAEGSALGDRRRAPAEVRRHPLRDDDAVRCDETEHVVARLCVG